MAYPKDEDEEQLPVYPGAAQIRDPRDNRGRWPDNETRWIENNPADAIGDEIVAVSNTVKKLAVPDGANHALIQVQAQSVRWTETGRAPIAATTGYLNIAGDFISLGGRPQLTQFLAIREGGADSQLFVTYFN